MNRLHGGRMTTDQIDTTQQVWAAPEPLPRRWGWRETAAAVAVAAVIAALGGAAVYAATAGNSHTFGAPRQAFGPDGGMPNGPGGPGGPWGQHGAIGAPGPAEVGATSLHGEIGVPDRAGHYTTGLTQSGAASAISPTSITVRSEHGSTQTYVIPSTAGTAGAPLAVDDQVVVRAPRDGQTATVTNIGNNPMTGGPPGLNGPGGPPP